MTQNLARTLSAIIGMDHSCRSGFFLQPCNQYINSDYRKFFHSVLHGELNNECSFEETADTRDYDWIEVVGPT